VPWRHMGEWRYSSAILDVSTRCRWVISLTLLIFNALSLLFACLFPCHFESSSKKYLKGSGNHKFLLGLFVLLLHLMVLAVEPVLTSHSHSIFSEVFLGLGIHLAFNVESVSIFYQMVYPVFSVFISNSMVTCIPIARQRVSKYIPATQAYTKIGQPLLR
jgi:hypothetical protein